MLQLSVGREQREYEPSVENAEGDTRRIAAIDTMRLLAVIGVICIHTRPFGNMAAYHSAYKWLALLLNQGARFAVPFFFVISGYLWGKRVRSGSPIFVVSTKMLKRLMLVFFAWSLLYALPYDIIIITVREDGLSGILRLAYVRLVDVASCPISALFSGTHVHLWFLPALACALGLASVFLYKGHVRSLVGVSLALYILGILSTAYVHTPIGIRVGFNARNGPFISTLPFVTGYLLSGRNPRELWLPCGLCVFFVGGLLHFSEASFLWRFYHLGPVQEHLAGTYLMGAGAATVALSDHPIIRSRRLGRLGQMTLGIYGVHMIWVDLFRPVDHLLRSSIWAVGYVLIVLCLSIVSVMLLCGNRYTKAIVS